MAGMNNMSCLCGNYKQTPQSLAHLGTCFNVLKGVDLEKCYMVHSLKEAEITYLLK
jgi:hypothetical protein